MTNRNINIGSGNYNETIKGNYYQSSNFELILIDEDTNRFNDYECTKQVDNYTIKESLNRFGDYKRTVKGPGYESVFTLNRFGDKKIKTPVNKSPISSSLSDFLNSSIPNSVKNRLNKSSTYSQVVQGNNNQVIQNSNSNIAIGNMDGGHIGDNVTIAGNINQVVKGNGNRVNQSILTNMNIGSDIEIGDITQENIFEDFWDEEPKISKTNTVLKEFASYIETKAEVLDKDINNRTGLLLAADDVVNVITNQPILTDSIKANKKSFFLEVKNQLKDNKMANKLLSIVENTF